MRESYLEVYEGGEGEITEKKSRFIATVKPVKEEAEAASENLVIIEAAVFDTAPKNFFDELWYVYTTKENRIVRLMENRGYSHEKCEDIIGRQASEEEYRALCSRVIDNNGDESDIKRQLKEILDHEIC